MIRASALLALLLAAGCHARREEYCRRHCARLEACIPSAYRPDCATHCADVFDRVLLPAGLPEALGKRRRQLVDCQYRCLGRLPAGVAPAGACGAIADCEHDCRKRFAEPAPGEMGVD
jgi:hypothetical protein